MNDTAPEIARLVRERMLERSGAERMLMGSCMFETAKAMIMASLPDGLTPSKSKSSFAGASTVMRLM